MDKDSKVPVIALTGCIGSGKSSASRIFETYGVACLDADDLAREVVKPDTEGLKEIVKHFGSNLLNQDGTLDRKNLGEIVFNSPEKKQELEDIVHPRVRTLYHKRVVDIENEKSDLNLHFILYSIPLLYESRIERDEFNAVALVYAPYDLCLSRIIKRDQCSTDLAKKKLDSQISIEEKRAKADIIIDNTSDLQHLEREVKQAYDLILDQYV